MRTAMAVLVMATLGCSGGDSGGLRGQGKSNWELSLDPPSELEAAQPVVALVMTQEGEPRETIVPVLVEGEPSRVSIGKYMEGETTEALAERIVPTHVEVDVNNVIMRPDRVLAMGQRYSVLAKSGLLGTILVSPNPKLAYLARVWPPRDSTQAALQTIYCGPAAPTEASEIELFPGAAPARLEPGLDSAGGFVGNCVRIIPSHPGPMVIQPPAVLGDYSFEPSPWSGELDLPEIPQLDCSTEESSFGPGCLLAEQDRVIIRAPASSTFWVLTSSLGSHWQAIVGGGRFTVPLSDRTEDGQLDALVFDLAGRSFAASARITPPPPAAHVLINEVMANPLGPEPAEEWVEIYNVGSATAEVIDWKLRDQSGEVSLPPLLIEPSAMVLLVREDFVGGQAGDVPPAAGTTLVRLPSLGKNGITNSGEAMTLVDANGNVVSTFPARASEREGVSVARRSAVSLDDMPEDFCSHATPGASPGAENFVE